MDTTNESAAFQLAVWEIVTETSSSALNVLDGSFYLERGASSAQRTLANDWLAAASSNVAVKSFTAQRLYSATTQDFVVFARVPPQPNASGQVPEPVSCALLGLALASLALTARRRT